MRKRFVTSTSVAALGAAVLFGAAPAQAAGQIDPGRAIGSIVGALTDGEYGYWAPIDRRQAWLESRIEAGVRDGSLNQREAARLRAEFREIAQLEARYRVGGLTAAEQADLDARFDRLSARISNQRSDAQARDWAPIDRRQAQLEARIEAGVRNGSLTAAEAARLRSDYRDLERLEARYRVGGLSAWERADLDERFDTLSARIRSERNDPQDRWSSINERQQRLDARIDAGVRNRTLTRAEAMRLRREFRNLVQLETVYRRNGLTAAERQDLDRRFDRLSAQIRDERRDGQRR